MLQRRASGGGGRTADSPRTHPPTHPLPSLPASTYPALPQCPHPRRTKRGGRQAPSRGPPRLSAAREQHTAHTKWCSRQRQKRRGRQQGAPTGPHDPGPARPLKGQRRPRAQARRQSPRPPPPPKDRGPATQSRARVACSTGSDLSSHGGQRGKCLVVHPNTAQQHSTETQYGTEQQPHKPPQPTAPLHTPFCWRGGGGAC
jgi:hypothetical protein